MLEEQALGLEDAGIAPAHGSRTRAEQPTHLVGKSFFGFEQADRL
jgi:hypothetical protein